MSSQIDQVMRKTQAYWYEDGFVEMASGWVFLVVAALLAAEGLVPRDSAFVPIFQIGLPVLAVATGIPVASLVMILKRHVTYPRTGFVRLHFDASRLRWMVAFVAFAAAVVIVLGGKWLDNVTAVGGLVMGAAFATIGLRVGALRFYVLAVWVSALGLSVGLMTTLAESWQIAALMAGAAVALIVSGLLALRGYLLHNPPAQEA